jgi:hypothetical protein
VLKDTIIILDYIASDGKIESKNGNGWARMGSVSDVMYYTRICLTNLRNTMENLSQCSQFRALNFKLGTPE